MYVVLHYYLYGLLILLITLPVVVPITHHRKKKKIRTVVRSISPVNESVAQLTAVSRSVLMLI